jgi:hypothetical protein
LPASGYLPASARSLAIAIRRLLRYADLISLISRSRACPLIAIGSLAGTARRENQGSPLELHNEGRRFIPRVDKADTLCFEAQATHNTRRPEPVNGTCWKIFNCRIAVDIEHLGTLAVEVGTADARPGRTRPSDRLRATAAVRS